MDRQQWPGLRKVTGGPPAITVVFKPDPKSPGFSKMPATSLYHLPQQRQGGHVAAQIITSLSFYWTLGFLYDQWPHVKTFLRPRAVCVVTGTLSVAGSWIRPQTHTQIKSQQKMALAVIKLW